MRNFSTYLTASLLLASTFTVQASLTSYNVNGVDLVYSSVSNVTWTKDANLLNTLGTAQGYSNLIDAIIAASPTVTDTPNALDGNDGIYDLSASDFGTNGRANWFAAQGFVTYLNSINYGGSNQWRLPDSGNPPETGYNVTSSEFGQLWYTELGASGVARNANFSNFQSGLYWEGAERSANARYAWNSDFTDPVYHSAGFGKNTKSFYLFAVTPGQVSAVPVPGAIWLFGSALLGVLGLKRRGTLATV